MRFTSIEIDGINYKCKLPDYCPLCHNNLTPNELGSNIIHRGDALSSKCIQIIYRCPNNDCQNAFIANYERESGYETKFYLASCSPKTTPSVVFEEAIENLSPSYVELHTQSQAAEAYELDQIAGAGYRKSLEFLVKDFAIHENESDKDKIKSMFLGKVIKTYLEDPRLKACAERATWLGNDETHYVRTWKEKDITNLKELIDLTKTWILYCLKTNHYSEDMKTPA